MVKLSSQRTALTFDTNGLLTLDPVVVEVLVAVAALVVEVLVAVPEVDPRHPAFQSV